MSTSTAPNCQDPDILAMRAQLAHLRELADAPATGAVRFGATTAGASALAGRIGNLAARLARAEQRYMLDIRYIMAGCRQIGMDEGTRRVWIGVQTRQRTSSLRQTTAAERARLAEDLRSKGFAERPGAKPARRRAVTVTPPATLDGVHSKIKAMLADAGRTYPYADAIARKRFGVDCWEWLDYDSACKLMQMLIMDQSRRARRAAQAGAAT